VAAELKSDFRLRCEKIAADVRRDLSLQAFAPLPGECLARSLEIEIATLEQLPALAQEVRDALNRQRIWGALLRGVDLPTVILIRSDQPPARRQSTLMHEIAHFLLDHAGDDLATALSGAARDTQQEAEARYLGGCLQIPRAGLLWAAQSGYSRARAAAHFCASEQMVRWRCNATNIAI
jgi:Zn-dependent peptidase ImmA (M78 family)